MSELSTSTAAPLRFGQGFLTDLWYFVTQSAALKHGALQRFYLANEPILLARSRTGALFALRDICPHRAAPFSAGKLIDTAAGETRIECPYHGWQFDTDGACRAIPALVEGQAVDIGRIRVRRYPVLERDGLVFVYLGSGPRDDGKPVDQPPAFPGLVGGRPKIIDHMDFDTHIDHAVVGLMDPTHAPFVHQAWWARSSKQQHDKTKAFEPSDLGFVMTRHARSKANHLYDILGGQPAVEITFRLPGYRWEHIQVGRYQVLALTCLTPVTDQKTRITQLIWSDHPVMAVAPMLAPFARAFLRQDGDMVNLQNLGLRYDPALIWIDDADKQAKWYQQLKREWLASRREGRPFANPVAPTILRWRS